MPLSLQHHIAAFSPRRSLARGGVCLFNKRGVNAKVSDRFGITQYAATDSPAQEALSAVVVDAEDNRIANIVVTFTIDEGDAAFGNGGKTITVNTDKYGVAAARPIMGSTPGAVRISAKALNPMPGTGPVDINGAGYQITVLAQQDGPTRFTGKVLDHTGTPLPGVRVSIGRTSLLVTSDTDGNFTFADQVPPGKLDLFIDGRTATANNKQYPSLHFEALAIRGQNNILPHAIHLPPLLTSQVKIVGGNSDVTLTIPGFDGFEMVVKANSVTFPDGAKTGPLVVSPVLLDKLPMVPPGGYAGFMAPAWTIQPSGTRFDPPIEVKIPNSLNLKPGEGREIYQWDHDLATFVPMGRATVSEDGALLVSDAGSGITKAGWGGGPNPPPVPPKCATSPEPTCNECQSLKSGVNCPNCEFEANDQFKNALKVNLYELDISAGALGGWAVNILKKIPVVNLLVSLPSAKVKAVVQTRPYERCCRSSKSKITDTDFSGSFEIGSESKEIRIIGGLDTGIFAKFKLKGSGTLTYEKTNCRADTDPPSGINWKQGNLSAALSVEASARVVNTKAFNVVINVTPIIVGASGGFDCALGIGIAADGGWVCQGVALVFLKSEVQFGDFKVVGVDFTHSLTPESKLPPVFLD